jgi:uncharacterized protein
MLRRRRKRKSAIDKISIFRIDDMYIITTIKRVYNMFMHKGFLFVVGILVFILIAVGFVFLTQSKAVLSPLGKESDKVVEMPFEKYTFENLRKKQFVSSQILLGNVVDDEKDFHSQMFYYDVDGKKVSGLINLPKKEGTYPIIVMFRGFVEREIYETGVGTKRAGEVFAKNGYITLAPDFLGYGESASSSASSLEDRFLTYTTALTLLTSLENLNNGLTASYSAMKADVEQVGIWGHSNGGQISLSVLAITQKNYPTVLWAPVTKPFPYSVLYFTDEFEDNGKALRKVVADFEKEYDIENYSTSNYYKDIIAPIQLHQGTADDAVPVRWSNQFVEKLEALEKDIDYFVYPGADHNLNPSWSTAVDRSLQFYNKQLKE